MPEGNEKPIPQPSVPSGDADEAVVRLKADGVTHAAQTPVLRLDEKGVREVRDDIIREERVMRLGQGVVEEKVIRTRTRALPVPDARLVAPKPETTEAKRTHQPDMDAILEGPEAMALADETSWGRRDMRHIIPWGWFAVLVVILFGFVAWSIRNVISADEEIDREHLEIVETLTRAEATDQELADNLDRVSAAARAFCLAPDEQALAEVVRQPERVKPLMDDHYRRHAYEKTGFHRQRSMQVALLETGKSFWIVTVDTASGKPKALVVEETEDGRCLVDWETAVLYQPMPWDDYALNRPQDTLLDFRVTVAEDNFHSHEFADSDRWASFLLTAPDSTEFLWGYALRGSVEEQIMRNALTRSEDQNEAVSMILRLGLPTGTASRRGVVINRVLSTRWIYILPPD